MIYVISIGAGLCAGVYLIAGRRLVSWLWKLTGKEYEAKR